MRWIGLSFVVALGCAAQVPAPAAPGTSSAAPQAPPGPETEPAAVAVPPAPGVTAQDPRVGPAPVSGPAATPRIAVPTVPPGGRWAIAGARGARYRFPIPTGFSPLGEIRDPFGIDPVELDEAGSSGVALPSPTALKPSSVVVFSDPLGLGFDAARQPIPDALVGLLDRFMKDRFAQASTPTLVAIGPWRAFRTDLGEVVIPDRPVRAGRSYLILDGTVTATVDCLWLPADAAVVAAACDLVAARLERAPAP